MKKVDVLIIYETKVRELESDCLIKIELERRGYSVGIINTWNEYGKAKKQYDADVVVAPSMYNDGIYDFVKSLSGRAEKVVNLQWEQIGPVGDESKSSAWYLLKGLAHQCMNVCWGTETYNRLRYRAGIDEDHLCITGQVALDFARPEFEGYYLGRNELFSLFGIPADKQINLFISSFSYVNLPETQIKQSLFSEVEQFINTSKKSFEGILDWIDDLLNDKSDQVFIYRPHPSEAGNTALDDMVRKYPNRFFVISEKSVKQWISAVDRVYTWYSTSTAEAYAFGKPVGVLRPVIIPADMETTLLVNVTKIEEYEGFKQSIVDGNVHNLRFDDFSKYYQTDEVPAYMKVCDVIERMILDDRYIIHDNRVKERESLKMRIKRYAHNAVGIIARHLPSGIHFLDKYKDLRVEDNYTLSKRASNYADSEEISEIENRLKTVLKY